MRGHYSPNPLWTNEVWGLDPLHTDNDRYLTCSDDATLRLYSASQRKCIAILPLDTDKKGKTLKRVKIKGFKGKGMNQKAVGRTVGISWDDKIIVVGMKDGTIWAIEANPKSKDLDMKRIKMWKPPKCDWISDIKFSPDNKKVAIGSHNNKIYLYNTKSWKKCVRPMNKHSSYITHIDWSEDGSYLHSNCGAYEILFWNVHSGL